MNQRLNKTSTLIILDRDGVINDESTAYIKNPDEWLPISGSLEAIAALYQAGYTLVIATNQSGIGRAYYSIDMLHAIHQKMHDALTQLGGSIHAIYFCPHHPATGCDCRKPKPGLLHTIAKDYPHLFIKPFFVGDSMRDIQAGIQANCQPVLVKTGHGTQAMQHIKHLPDIPIFKNLSHFAAALLKTGRSLNAVVSQL